MGGGNLATQSKKRGFAISGILYPLLILTLFLVVQMLFMLQTRKNVLDKTRMELSDSVNASNEVYTNEELSTLILQQADLITSQTTEINTLKNKMKTLESDNSILKNNSNRLKTFTNGAETTYPLKFNYASRGSILIFGSANGLEVLTNILFESFTPSSPRFEVNNKGASYISVDSLVCDTSYCTMVVNFKYAWGNFTAISNSPFKD